LDGFRALPGFPEAHCRSICPPEKLFEPAGIACVSISRQEILPMLSLLLLGLFKKLVIADSLTSQAAVAFRASALPEAGDQFLTPLYIQGFYLYAVQIYADFSGYTDIARASAGLLGVKLPENFQQPYLSATISDFWNRWHMSLTQWFREYLYFPLTRKMLAFMRPRKPAYSGDGKSHYHAPDRPLARSRLDVRAMGSLAWCMDIRGSLVELETEAPVVRLSGRSANLSSGWAGLGHVQ
jgi:hypothetical protein